MTLREKLEAADVVHVNNEVAKGWHETSVGYVIMLNEGDIELEAFELERSLDKVFVDGVPMTIHCFKLVKL